MKRKTGSFRPIALNTAFELAQMIAAKEIEFNVHSGPMIEDDYCPRCGARKLVMDFTHTSILRELHLFCALCRYGFGCDVDSRWRAKKFNGTNFRKDTPVLALLNVHNKIGPNANYYGNSAA